MRRAKSRPVSYKSGLQERYPDLCETGLAPRTSHVARRTSHASVKKNQGLNGSCFVYTWLCFCSVVSMLVFTSFMLLLVARVHADCLVSIAQGTARGSLMNSYHGKEFCSYNGIPYAAPPVEDLRFRSPEPPAPWNGELNATKPGNSCLQYRYAFYAGSEDCLYLNVHTPQTSSSGELLPVMIFIHGGAYLEGSGKAYSYGPLYLMDKDVVMVAMNYRLGVFGFLSTGDDAAPGNYGMKDQTEALRWVQKNIAAFGGDPNKVTILGESAGSWSVHFHILSPASRGLFHAAISESGTAMLPLFMNTESVPNLAQLQAGMVNCPTDNTADMIQCLRKVDAVTLFTNPPVGVSFPVVLSSLIITKSHNNKITLG
ncbi:hypothetical protein ANN_27061 [Periplaneta americana]|uniref:Carboxylic ester hydrolase n=1 Tax=Periplaneta americana TaxID=6978 RepID=A0ABQ8RX50_PERAM|nr:hypothetical protein ANN_27061 [Periplaneta americana]